MACRARRNQGTENPSPSIIRVPYGAALTGDPDYFFADDADSVALRGICAWPSMKRHRERVDEEKHSPVFDDAALRMGCFQFHIRAALSRGTANAELEWSDHQPQRQSSYKHDLSIHVRPEGSWMARFCTVSAGPH